MSKKILKLLGQVTPEYALVFMLVAAGIIIMGPYVVRSWNAYFMGWDDAINDAYVDPFMEHGHEDFEMPGCECHSEPGGCNSAGCGCDEQSYVRVCEPAGCADGTSITMEYCVVDESCCCPEMRECSIDANIPPNDGGGCPEGSEAYDGRCVCPNGYREKYERCGSGTEFNFVGCEVDGACWYGCVWRSTAGGSVGAQPDNSILCVPPTPPDRYDRQYTAELVEDCDGTSLCKYNCDEANGYHKMMGGCRKCPTGWTYDEDVDECICKEEDDAGNPLDNQVIFGTAYCEHTDAGWVCNEGENSWDTADVVAGEASCSTTDPGTAAECEAAISCNAGYHLEQLAVVDRGMADIGDPTSAVEYWHIYGCVED